MFSMKPNLAFQVPEMWKLKSFETMAVFNLQERSFKFEEFLLSGQGYFVRDLKINNEKV